MPSPAQWCPKCGEVIPHLFPFCGQDKTPTPLYVEANICTLYMSSVATFVEFRLTNVSDEPLILERFTVSIGQTTLHPGIHEEGPGVSIMPGEGNALVIDRKVCLDAKKQITGWYDLALTVAVSQSNFHAVLRGAQKVFFEHSSPMKLRYIEPFNGEEQEIDLKNPPLMCGDVTLPFGEAGVSDPALAFIRMMKGKLGLCFLPVRMRYEHALDTTSRYFRKSCPACGARISDGGLFCGQCGKKIDIPPPIAAPSPEETKCYCSHCLEPGGSLREYHPYCTHCGKPMPLYIDLRKATVYMDEIQGPATLRLYPTGLADICIESARLVLQRGGEEYACSLDNFHPGMHIPALHEPVELEASLCAPKGWNGFLVLRLIMQVSCQGQRMECIGSTRLKVLSSNTDQKEIINNFGPQTVQAAETAVVSGGAWNIKLELGPQGNKRQEYIETILEIDFEKAVFQPFRTHITSLTAMTKNLPPAPTWPPMDRARFFCIHNDLPHVHCLLTQRRLVFGRSIKDADVRLLEVEVCKPRLDRQQRRGLEPSTESKISRRQWLVELDKAGLMISHAFSQGNVSYLPGGKELKHGDPPYALKLGESIELPDVIGLKYAAHAPRQPFLSDAFKTADRILKNMDNPPPESALWPGDVDGCTLTRLYSLTGEIIGNRKQYSGFEAYVLMQAWATIGSSTEASVRVAGDGVSPLHAYLLFRNGYFFILPAGKSDAVAVDDEPVEPKTPYPLRPGCDIMLSSTRLHFDVFGQLYV